MNIYHYDHPDMMDNVSDLLNYQRGSQEYNDKL